MKKSEKDELVPDILGLIPKGWTIEEFLEMINTGIVPIVKDASPNLNIFPPLKEEYIIPYTPGPDMFKDMFKHLEDIWTDNNVEVGLWDVEL